jgi:hypothetical protein
VKYDTDREVLDERYKYEDIASFHGNITSMN